MYIAAALIFFGLLLAFSIEVVITVAAVVLAIAGAAKLAEHHVRRRGEGLDAVDRLEPPPSAGSSTRVITPDSPLWFSGRVPR